MSHTPGKRSTPHVRREHADGSPDGADERICRLSTSEKTETSKEEVRPESKNRREKEEQRDEVWARKVHTHRHGDPAALQTAPRRRLASLSGPSLTDTHHSR